MASEIWQFAAFLGVVAVAFVLWLNIIYLPGRTLEHRYDGVGPSRQSPAPSAHSSPSAQRSQQPDEGEVSQSSSDPTR
jgi:hypothetical protein